MTQILINLVSNAIKFTDKGGVQIQADWFPDANTDITKVDSLLDLHSQREKSEGTNTPMINEIEKSDSGSI